MKSLLLEAFAINSYSIIGYHDRIIHLKYVYLEVCISNKFKYIYFIHITQSWEQILSPLSKDPKYVVQEESTYSMSECFEGYALYKPNIVLISRWWRINFLLAVDELVNKILIYM